MCAQVRRREAAGAGARPVSAVPGPPRPAAQLGSPQVAAAPGLLSRTRLVAHPLPTLFRRQPHLPAFCASPASAKMLKDWAALRFPQRCAAARPSAFQTLSTVMQAPHFTGEEAKTQIA